jgi:PPK2 family polyphosphate:nucleotide phosphotransferase
MTDSPALGDLLRFEPGARLADVDPHSTTGFSGGKAEGKAALAAGGDELSTLQEKLFAEGRTGGHRSLLLVVQGMDTSGKGGIMRHVVGSVDPQGVDHTAFGAPTEEERRHHFLWRVRRALPRAGRIGVFDRSHYEDVLVARVHELVARAEWSRRYDRINAFEEKVAGSGTTIVKVMLHISRDEQLQRLLARLDNPKKHWKYNPGDVDDRLRWDDYTEAYQDALTRCSTPPWFVVPADRKWYARWAVQQLILEHLRTLDLRWPEASFDVEAERQRLLATT